MYNKDLYGILGLDRNASESDIKKAYRKLAVKYHPDKFAKGNESEKKAAEEKFKEITEAYSVLSDPDKKRKYDMFGSADGGYEGPEFSPEDIFRDFMRDTGFGDFSGMTQREVSGTDKKVKINVSIEDIYAGGYKDVTYTVYRPCETCEGRGTKDDVDIRCPYCGGTGMISEEKRFSGMYMRNSHPCSHCGGTGYIIKNPCKDCHGTGLVEEKVTRKILIPNIDHIGYTYSVSMEGNSCHNNMGPNGDLYFMFAVKEDRNQKFAIDRRKVGDVLTYIDVPVIDCIAGKNTEIDFFKGEKIRVSIPKRTRDGQEIRIHGRGFKLSNGGCGDLVVKVRMTMPELSDEKINKIKEVIEG